MNYENGNPWAASQAEMIDFNAAPSILHKTNLYLMVFLSTHIVFKYIIYQL